MAAAVRLAAFLPCRPRPSARETAASLQPRRPFFSLYREKKSAEKRENLDTAKEETPFLRFASEKRRFILPTGTTSLNPQCRKVGIAVICHRGTVDEGVQKKEPIGFAFWFPLQCLAWKESCARRFSVEKLQGSRMLVNQHLGIAKTRGGGGNACGIRSIHFGSTFYAVQCRTAAMRVEPI